MPRYQVIAPGFFGGKYYNPEGKRRTLTTSKPFPKKELPSWLAPMPKESEAVRKKREAQEASQVATDDEKAKQDQQDINDVSFLGDGETAGNTAAGDTAAAGSKVETI